MSFCILLRSAYCEIDVILPILSVCACAYEIARPRGKSAPSLHFFFLRIFFYPFEDLHAYAYVLPVTSVLRFTC